MSQLRNIAVLILASASSMVGAGLLNPYFFVYFREQGISFIGLGAIFSAASVGSLLLRPFLGYISDVYGRKKLIVGFSFLVSLLTPPIRCSSQSDRIDSCSRESQCGY